MLHGRSERVKENKMKKNKLLEAFADSCTEEKLKINVSSSHPWYFSLFIVGSDLQRLLITPVIEETSQGTLDWPWVLFLFFHYYRMNQTDCWPRNELHESKLQNQPTGIVNRSAIIPRTTKSVEPPESSQKVWGCPVGLPLTLCSLLLQDLNQRDLREASSEGYWLFKWMFTPSSVFGCSIGKKNKNNHFMMIKWM